MVQAALIAFLTSVLAGFAVRRRVSRRLACWLTASSTGAIAVALGALALLVSGDLPSIHPYRAIVLIGVVLLAGACLLPTGVIALFSRWGESERARRG